MKRFEKIEDYIEFKCKKCGSNDIWIYAEECNECGLYINSECNSCKAEYKYHDFKQIMKGIKHTKEFGVYHWDTFDNETTFCSEFDKLEDAKSYITSNFNTMKNGADQVDIIDLEGNVVEIFKIG